MHQIVLLTALTATSGLFGGGRCAGGRCATAYTPTYACQPGTPCAGQAYYAQPTAYSAPQAPAYTAPQAPAYSAPQAPVAAPHAAVAPARIQAPAAPVQAAYYPSYYYPTTTQGCVGGNCYRR